jgi:hypothetical protein
MVFTNGWLNVVDNLKANYTSQRPLASIGELTTLLENVGELTDSLAGIGELTTLLAGIGELTDSLILDRFVVSNCCF